MLFLTEFPQDDDVMVGAKLRIRKGLVKLDLFVLFWLLNILTFHESTLFYLQKKCITKHETLIEQKVLVIPTMLVVFLQSISLIV